MKTGFNDFWPHYPKKIGKAQAKEKWAKMLSEHPVTGLEIAEKEMTEILIAAITAQKLYRKKTPEKKHPDWVYPERWIRYERWSDEIESISEGTKTTNVSRCECGQTATQQGGLCPRCWGRNHTDEDKECFESLQRQGKGRRVGESQHDHRMRCKEELPALLKTLFKKIIIQESHIKQYYKQA